MSKPVGLDFGTTNSTIAVAETNGSVRLAAFQDDDRLTEAFRSILYFFHPLDDHSNLRDLAAGPEAIKAYFTSEPRGRLIQSMKSFLASRLFIRTTLYKSTYTLEDLIALVVRELKNVAQQQGGDVGSFVVVGRPVRFSGAKDNDDNEFAVNRLRTAVQEGGFDHVHFEYEPVAAAYRYEQQLDRDELVLIADFGGGTSDFSLLRLGPSMQNAAHGLRDILGTDGVAIGGNNFDSTLIRHLVAPELGLGTLYRSLGKLLPTPPSLFRRFERWHYLSFLKTKETMNMLNRIRQDSLEPRKIENLIHVIENDLGFQLNRAIERLKVDLSDQETSIFEFRESPVDICKEVTRQEFDLWIKPYILELGTCIDRLLTKCKVASREVDSVFMTGGSSFVPAVRKLFEGKFGASRLRGGGELTSVGEGLGLRALNLFG